MKYIFDPTGCSIRSNRYVVDFFNCGESNDGKTKPVASFQISTPLTLDELIEFVETRQSPIVEKFGIWPSLRNMRSDEKTESGIGLASLSWYLSGKGITKKTIGVSINGKLYRVDPDKFETLLKSLE